MKMRSVALPWKNGTFDSPDGSLRVRNSAQLGPYPPRFTERLRQWAAVAPDRVLFACRDGEGWRKATYLEALNSACAIGQVPLRLAGDSERQNRWQRDGARQYR